MRISNGPSAIKLKPLAASSSCMLLTPKSASKPSTEAGCKCRAIELKASPIKVTRGAWLPNSRQTPSNFSCASAKSLGIPVKANQMPLSSKQPCNPDCVPGQTQRAIHHRSPRTHPEKINHFLKKNRRMSFDRFLHALPLGGHGVQLRRLRSVASDWRSSADNALASRLCSKTSRL